MMQFLKRIGTCLILSFLIAFFSIGLSFAQVYSTTGEKQDVDLKKVNGTTIDTNSGNKSAGTTRVVIATDQPSLTNAIPVSLTGVSTAANQTTIIGHVDGIEGFLATLAGAVSGTEFQVDLASAIPAGNNNIGDMDVASIAAGTNYIGRFRLTDGTLNISLLDLTTRDAFPVAIVDTNGDQIGSFGGGVQYTEGDTDATMTGTVMMWEDGSDTAEPVSAASPLPVNVVAGGTSGTQYDEGDDVATTPTGTLFLWRKAGDLASPVDASNPLPVSLSGVSTAANQTTIAGHVDGIETLLGTSNTNTGSAATLLGTIDTDTGNIATSVSNIDTDTSAIQTAVQIMDDWDETDRAKVNIIAGQVGITAGAGAVAANTPRVTHASDDPAVTALQILDNAISGNEIQADILTIAAGDNNIGNVDIVSSALPSGAATSANQSTVITALQLIDNIIKVDDTATHSTGTTEGALIMAVAVPTDTAVSANDIAAPQMTTDRKLVVKPYSATPSDVSGVQTSANTDTTSDALIAASGDAGLKTYITMWSCFNDHATVGTVVLLKDGSEGTAKAVGYVAPLGGAFVMPLPNPIASTANTAWHTDNVTTGSSVYCTGTGYTAP